MMCGLSMLTVELETIVFHNIIIWKNRKNSYHIFIWFLFFSQLFYRYYWMRKKYKKTVFFSYENKGILPLLPEPWICSMLTNQNFGCKNAHNNNEVKYMLIYWIYHPSFSFLNIAGKHSNIVMDYPTVTNAEDRSLWLVMADFLFIMARL